MHAQQETVGRRFRGGKHLCRQDAVEEAVQVGMHPSHGSHLLVVGTGDHRSPYTVTAQVVHKVEHAGNERIVHFLLEAVESGGDFRLLVCHVGEKSLVDIGEGLSLDASFQVGHTQIVHAHTVPENTVLRLGVYHHSVKVEEDGDILFVVIHTLSVSKFGCKVLKSIRTLQVFCYLSKIRRGCLPLEQKPENRFPALFFARFVLSLQRITPYYDCL